RGQVSPCQMAGGQLLASVSDDSQEAFVGVQDATVGVPDNDADDVGVDQPSDPRLPLLKIAVETCVLQRNGSLGGQELEKGNPGGSAGPGRQVVFEMDHPDQPGLLEQRHAEHGTYPAATHVLIAAKRVLLRRIVQKHAFTGAQNLVESRLRQISLSDSPSWKGNRDGLTVDR